MYRLLIPAALLIAPVALYAQDAPVAGKPPQRVRDVALIGTETCPKPVGDEVVVCHRIEEPYRLPKAFRQAPVPPSHQSWVRRTETMDEVGRKAGGLPDTCSAVGTGGATGCTAEMIRAWTAERKAAQADAAPAR